MNLMNQGTRPGAGTSLQLRRAMKGKPPVSEPEEVPRGGEEQEEIRIELNLD
jgi:hypothetical protein